MSIKERMEIMYAKNTWEKYKDQLNEVFDYNEGYKHYISKNKTERACVKDSIKLAEEKGFKPLESFDTLKSGDKVYVTNREKNIALFINPSLYTNYTSENSKNLSLLIYYLKTKFNFILNNEISYGNNRINIFTNKFIN